MDSALPEDVVIENCPCPRGCSLADNLMLLSGDRVNNLPGQFSIVQCRACGLVRTNPRPTPETIGYYYPDSYGPYHSTRIDSVENPELQPRKLRSLVRRSLNALVNLQINSTPNLKPGRLLEVGCASGMFLHQMELKGWSVEGIEFSEMASSYARLAGHKVTCSSIERAPDPDQPYDLIAGWMVLEHLHEPVAALRKLHSWSRPGGWLAISVPNLNCLGFRVFKESWFHLHLPNHLFHYTSETLVNVLQAGGWEVERVVCQRDVSDLVGSLGNMMKDRGRFPALAEKLVTFPSWQGKLYLPLFPLSWLLAAFGLTWALTVWARRTDDESNGPDRQ